MWMLVGDGPEIKSKEEKKKCHAFTFNMQQGAIENRKKTKAPIPSMYEYNRGWGIGKVKKEREREEEEKKCLDQNLFSFIILFDE